MTFTFTTELPVDLLGSQEVISGTNSHQFAGKEYLLIKELGNPLKAFEIKYKFHCSSYKEAAVCDDLLLVGHEGHFYLYDLFKQQNILTLEMFGYFSHLYIHQNLFYVSDAGSIYCLNRNGQVIWKNTSLGIDGVIIDRFSEDKIYGSGECDPPGGWVDFVLELSTGKNVVENVG